MEGTEQNDQQQENTSSTITTTIETPITTNNNQTSASSEELSQELKLAINDLTFGFQSIFKPEFDSICSHLQELRLVFSNNISIKSKL